MRIAIIGPTHPYKGGIAQQTTTLAHQLSVAGHQVSLISWKTQYPFFYPGAQFVPDGRPELPEFGGARRVLSWKNPPGWWRWGRRLRTYDQLIFIWWVPTIQGPVYASMLRALGKQRPRVAVICHNVLPHEPRPGDRALIKAVLGRADVVIVHTAAQARAAAVLTKAVVKTAELPLALAAPPAALPKKTGLNHQLLFFGVVRPYKGLDVLLRTLAKVPDVSLLIIGEFWDDSQKYHDLLDSLKLNDRVELRQGYMPSTELAEHIAQADAVVLPYRGGTASQHVALAHAYGTPVIATTAASFADQVKDGVDGLLCQPDDAGALAEAINKFYKPGMAAKLRRGVKPDSIQAGWQAYLQAILD